MSMVYHVTRSQTNDGGGGTIGLNLEHYALYLTQFTSVYVVVVVRAQEYYRSSQLTFLLARHRNSLKTCCCCYSTITITRLANGPSPTCLWVMHKIWNML
jgi:hypothetical protein